MIKALCLAIAAPTLLLLNGCASSTGSSEPKSLSDAKPHFAKFGTNKVHYVVEGKGKHTLILVHCWSGNLGFWQDQVPALADKARLVLIDLPGHGQSDKPHTAYTMDFFAEAVLAVMNDAHVDKATFIGHSMGVPVICRVCKHAPDRVVGLVSVDGTLRKPKIPPEQAEQFIGGIRAPEYRQNVRQFMGAMFPIPGTEALRDRVITEMLETPQYVMLGAMEGMFGSNEPDWDLQHVNIPVFVLNAPNPMWNDDYKAYVRSLSPQSDYRTIDGTGHWLMLEKPSEFNADLLEMLRKSNLIDQF
jgi:pimeloyl-ACP methyl ester carboxylesterase